MIVKGPYTHLICNKLKIEHTIDIQALHQLEVIVGHDLIMRVNVDGKCVFRIRMVDDCEFVLNTPVELVDIG